MSVRRPASALFAVAALLMAVDGGSEAPGAQVHPVAETRSGRVVDGAEAGVWRFVGEQDQVISVTVRSDAFRPTGRLLLSDGAELAAGTSLVATLPRTGDYLVVVDSVDGVVHPVPYQVAVRPVEPLALDVTATGHLEPGAAIGAWAFPGSRGQVVSVTAYSEVFDPFLELSSPDGKVLAWAHGARPGGNAHLVAVLSRTGNHVVRVTLADGEAGPYELVVRGVRPRRLDVDLPAAGWLGLAVTK